MGVAWPCVLCAALAPSPGPIVCWPGASRSWTRPAWPRPLRAATRGAVLYETPRGGQEDAWGYRRRRHYALSAPGDYLAYRWIFADLYPYYNQTGRAATPTWDNATSRTGIDQEWALAASSYAANAQHVWRAFNGRADVHTDYWSSVAGTYLMPSGLPAAGAAVTYNVDGTGSAVGEWLQSSPLTAAYWADPNRSRTFAVAGTTGFYTTFRLVVLETLSVYGSAVVGELSFAFDELALRNQPQGYSDPGSAAQLLAPVWNHKAGYTGQDADLVLSSSSSLSVDQDV
eukprot:g56193.t1